VLERTLRSEKYQINIRNMSSNFLIVKYSMLVECVDITEILWWKISVLTMHCKLNFGVTNWVMIPVFC
jgi:hypothetical protein